MNNSNTAKYEIPDEFKSVAIDIPEGYQGYDKR